MTVEVLHENLRPLEWEPSPNFSSRRSVAITHLVWHSTAGAFEPSLHWLCEPTVYDRHGDVVSGPDASCHLMIDEHGQRVAQLVHLLDKAWHCEAWNAFTVGVEHASHDRGFATPDQHVQSARDFAWLCKRFRIPPVDGLHKARGIVRHRDLGHAGGGHSDGPSDSMWHRWLGDVAGELHRDGLRKQWAR